MKYVLLALSLFSFVVPVHAAEPVKRLLIAHRGLSGVVPENTILAIKMTVAHGGNAAEIDVHRTSDGVVVLMHDRNLKRTTGLDADVTKTDFQTVRSLDAGTWKGKAFAGERVPTLEEALVFMKRTGCTPIIELKQDDIEKDVVDLVAKTDLIDEAFVISFKIKHLQAVRKLEPRIKTAPIIFNQVKVEGDPAERAEEFAAHFMRQADLAETKYITANKRYFSVELVDILHAKGYYLWSGVGNSIPEIRRYLNKNRLHDGLTTDRIDLLAELLKEHDRKQVSAP